MASEQHSAPPNDDVEGKIFVGGLSWQTTEESMRSHFEKFGVLRDIALMIDKRTCQPRGFGFITMKDPAAADIVVTTEHTIDGRVVDVKRAVPRDMAPAPTRAESKKVFVGGLLAEVTEKEFADYFGSFGLVKDVAIMVDRATNKSRGFGFVTFETEEGVEAVMRNKCEIAGKWVEVKRAEPRDSRDSQRASGNMSSGSPGGMQHMDNPNGGARNGRGGGMYGGPYDDANGRGGYGGRAGLPDYGNQGPQGYGVPQGYGGRGQVPSPVNGYGGVRYPAGYGGAAVSNMNHMNRGAPVGPPYPSTQMYAQQPQPMGYYSYNFSAATGPPMAGGYGNGIAGGARQATITGQGVPGNTYVQPVMQQQVYGYGAAPIVGYGGSYNIAAGYGPGPGVGPPLIGGQHRGGPVSQDLSFNETGYGAYRGQGAAQGRVDRSYRPY